MYTRCIACHVVHPLNAALLAQGAGQYRCGKCNKVNDALQSLFDEWPDAGQSAPEAGSMPVLGISITMTPASPAGISAEEDIDGQEGTERKKNRSHIAWVSVALVLLLVTLLNFAYFFGSPLLKNPLIHEGLVRVGLQEEPLVAPRQEPGQVQLVSSDMRSHPSASDALRLNALITNRAAGQQAYPVLEVILLDSSGQALASRLFEPSEYLAKDADIGGGMSPQAHLPVVLDLVDPGQQVVGFELKIH